MFSLTLICFHHEYCAFIIITRYREELSSLLEGLGLAGLRFEPGMCEPSFNCLPGPLQITRTASAAYSIYESGLYLFITLCFIVTNTPIYFVEGDIFNDDRIANKIIHWIKIGGKLSI